MALQVSKVASTQVCLGVSQTTHDLYGLTPKNPWIFWLKTIENYPLLKEEPVKKFKNYFPKSNRAIK
jgi:hypothetical protein